MSKTSKSEISRCETAEVEDRGVSPTTRSRSTILLPGTRRIVSRERRVERKKRTEKKINKTDSGSLRRQRNANNNNNKQRYRRGLMLILIDRAIYDPDFNFDRDVRELSSPAQPNGMNNSGRNNNVCTCYNHTSQI